MTTSVQPNWAAIRHAYCYGDTPVRRLCRDFGISDRQLYKRRREESWPWRKAREAPTEPSRALGERLRRVVERQLFHLEQRLTATETVTGDGAAQRERDARTMSALVRIYEKLVALQDARGEGSTRDVDQTGDHGIRDIDERRDALAQRLAQLQEQGGS